VRTVCRRRGLIRGSHQHFNNRGFRQHDGARGYRDDGDAGLLHVGARYYDPQVGRFTSWRTGGNSHEKAG